jgi:hypothetical protein
MLAAQAAMPAQAPMQALRPRGLETHFRWQRQLSPAAGHAADEQCVVLDADLYAHAAPGLRDVRLVQDGRLVPYAMDVSFDDRTGNSAETLPGDRAQYEPSLTLPLLPPQEPMPALVSADTAHTQLFAHGLLPAHVPVERIRVDPAPQALQGPLTLTLRAAPRDNLSNAESTVTKLTSQAPAVAFTIGANLQDDADIGVGVIADGDSASRHNNATLPHSVVLEMRRREICYQPLSASPVRMLLGNMVLLPVRYAYAEHFQPRQQPVLATMGPLQPNPDYRAPVIASWHITRVQRIELAIAACLIALLLTLAPLLRLRR